MISLQFLGGGRMAEALLSGLMAGDDPPDSVAVVEVSAARRDELAALFPGLQVRSEPGPARDVVVATKPDVVAVALGAAADAGVQRVLSIAAGVTLASLESLVGAEVPVVRAMPNTPALVGRAASAISGGSAAAPEDLAWARGLLGSVGVVVEVPEDQMDAVTGLSGSGPAYLFLVAEALIDAGERVGLPRATAEVLTRQTLLGAATLLAGDDAGGGGSQPAPEDLRAAVTSPGGTTAAGIRVLEDRDVRAAVVAAVEAATARSAELGS